MLLFPNLLASIVMLKERTCPYNVTKQTIRKQKRQVEEVKDIDRVDWTIIY